MKRNLPGRIISEAPPGPEMSEADFRVAMDNLGTDAARWRWLRRNWSSFLEMSPPRSGAQLQQYVDTLRKGGAIVEEELTCAEN